MALATGFDLTPACLNTFANQQRFRNSVPDYNSNDLGSTSITTAKPAIPLI
jgi:hypothetical protein